MWQPVSVHDPFDLTLKIPLTIQPWYFFRDFSYAMLAQTDKFSSPDNTHSKKKCTNSSALHQEERKIPPLTLAMLAVTSVNTQLPTLKYAYPHNYLHGQGFASLSSDSSNYWQFCKLNLALVESLLRSKTSEVKNNVLALKHLGAQKSRGYFYCLLGTVQLLEVPLHFTERANALTSAL